MATYGITNYNETPGVPRVAGSGFTVLHWQGQPIAFAQTISHQSPQPVAAPVAIQPIDAQRPIDIVTPAAIGPGTLQVALYELYNEKVWDKIMRIVDNGQQANDFRTLYNDLADVFVRLANIDRTRGISVARVIYPPTMFGNRQRRYADVYHNCKITDVRDDENIDIGTMDIAKVLTIQYTHTTRVSDEDSSSLYTSSY